MRTFAPLQEHPDKTKLGADGFSVGGMHVVGNELGYPNGTSLINNAFPRSYMRAAARHEGPPASGHKGALPPRDLVAEALYGDGMYNAPYNKITRFFAFPKIGSPDIAIPTDHSKLYLGDLLEYQGFANRVKNLLAGEKFKVPYKKLSHVDPTREDPGALDELVKAGLLKVDTRPDGSKVFSAGKAHNKHYDSINGSWLFPQPGGPEMEQLAYLLNVYQQLDKKVQDGSATSGDIANYDRVKLLLNHGWDEARNTTKPSGLGLYDSRLLGTKAVHG
jgi:hypothetical protein